MKLRLPALTTYQYKVYEWLGDCKGTGKIAVVKSVRQSGKSFLCQIILIQISLSSKCTSAWFAPTMEQARVFFKSIFSALNQTGLIQTANSTTLTLEFTNGSIIYFRSTTNDKNSRGFTVSGILILDECAYLPDESVYTILPLVNAHNAPILICSTPFIRDGYFYKMYEIGCDGNNDLVKSFDWSKEQEVERFLTPERKGFYKETMSRAKYTTEVLGEFLTDDGLLFQNLEACVRDTSNANILYIGIDFATGQDGDYTVLSAINECGEQFKLYRTNNLKPMAQINWLAGLINDLSRKYKVARILAEKNSIGAVYIDSLQKKINNCQITDWVTSNSSKQDLVTTFQIALENEYVHILPNDVLLNELKRYEQEINPTTKTIRYNGSKGAHDDCVIATMLSYYAYKTNTGTYKVSTHKKPRRTPTLAEKYG